MRLSGKEKRKVREALLHTFAKEELELVVSNAEIGKSFADLTFGMTGYEAGIHRLIEWTESQYRLGKLLTAAAEAAPENPELAEICALVRRHAAFRSDRSLGELEQVLFKNASFQNIVEWQAKLERLRGAVCRIEPQPRSEGLAGYATGFLVAPDVVMTNDHVVSGQDGGAGFWERPELAARVRCRFDCVYRGDGGVSEGEVHALAAEYRILRSSIEDCDFALIRLQRRAADDLVDERPRGFITPRDHAFESSEPIIIVQHPEAEPMKLAFGSLTPSADWPRDRIAYQTNTSPGSSGSPVATQALEVAAIHHWGSTRHNRGVPMSAILRVLRTHPERSRLERAGLGHLLSIRTP